MPTRKGPPANYGAQLTSSPREQYEALVAADAPRGYELVLRVLKEGALIERVCAPHKVASIAGLFVTLLHLLGRFAYLIPALRRNLLPSPQYSQKILFMELVGAPHLSCESEQIQHLNAIQPDGFLLSVAEDWTVLRASANIGAFLGMAPDRVLGLPVRQLIDGDLVHDIRGCLQSAEVVGRLFRRRLISEGAFFDIAAHRSVTSSSWSSRPRSARAAAPSPT